ncbi:MAG TPA: sigma-70 family RNA polymerase sigma factor [Candidatus Tumulicola sp.]|jgi:RNA polymerase sigma-70 factor (ECF subfamily)
MIAASVAIHESFERGFEREYADVVRCAYRVLGDRSDAEDVAQDVFVRFVGRRLPDTAVLRVAVVRRALNALRAKRRRVSRELAEYRSALADVPRSGNVDPFALVDSHARQILVRAALLRLKRRDSELLILRYSGADYRDLAYTLRIDAAQIGTRLARAERAFRKEIDDAFLQ